jgi:hypothetical protein
LYLGDPQEEKEKSFLKNWKLDVWEISKFGENYKQKIQQA